MAVFTDYVQGVGPTDVDKANRTSIGTITLSKGGSLLSVRAKACNVGTDAQSKPLCGYITLESDDLNIEPFEFPFPPTPSHLGATPHSSRARSRWYPINAPLEKQVKITVYCTLGIAAPQAAPEVFVEFRFSNGGPEGPQIHMKVLEPSGALSTGDNDETPMSTIELRDASKIIMVWAVATVATLVADESVIIGMKITCDDFLESGPCKFGLEPEEGGDATTSGTHLMVTENVVDRDLKNPPTTAVIQPTATQYDANNAAPECYVGIAYI